MPTLCQNAYHIKQECLPGGCDRALRTVSRGDLGHTGSRVGGTEPWHALHWTESIVGRGTSLIW